MADLNEERLRQDRLITESLAAGRQADRARAAARLKALGVNGSLVEPAPPGAQQPGESLSDFKKRTQAAVEAGTYVPPTRKEFGADVASKSAEIAMDLIGRIFPGGVAAETAKPATPAAAVPAPAEAPVEFKHGVAPPPAPAKAQPHPLSKYATVYEALRDLPDEKFKQFVDTHENVPGIGYVTRKVPRKDEKTGREWEEERIVRVIENPAEKAQEPMTLGEAEVASRVLAGVGAREEARESRAERNALLKEGIEARREATKESSRTRTEGNLEKMIASVGTTMDPNTGEKVVNPALALHRLHIAGYDEKDVPEHYKPVWKNVTSTFEKFVTDWENHKDRKESKGKKATAVQRKALSDLFVPRLLGREMK